MSETMKAIKVQAAKDAKLVSDAKKPALRPDYILVKVECVALNPTDWKHIDFLPTPNATVGCDYSGTVVDVGKDVTKPFKKGDRIAGVCHGVNSLQIEDGCFAEYAVVIGHTQVKIPDDMSFEEAATLGVGVTTTGQGLYQSLGLPLPNTPSTDKTPVLIYGGSTATGLFMIQFAKLSGLEVITTCSPRNFDLVKSFGADVAFDYSDAKKCAQQIREYTKDSLRHAEDCISSDESEQICADALSSKGGSLQYSGLLGIDEFPRKDVDAKATLAYTAKGEKLHFRGKDTPAMQDHKEFASKFWDLTQELLDQKKLKLFPTVREGGLQGVFGGLDDLRTGKVSGQKLVYRISDTK